MKHLLLTILLTLPAMADRQLTVTWDKYPSPIMIIILAALVTSALARLVLASVIDISTP
jgi:hypothetical protein